MELIDYLRVLRKYWVFVLITTVLGLLFAGTFSFLQTPVYSSNAKLFVTVHTATESVDELARGSNFVRQNLESYAQVALTDSVLSTVIDDLDLDETVQQLANNISVNSLVSTSILNFQVSSTDPNLAADIANTVADYTATFIQQEIITSEAEPENNTVQFSQVHTAVPNKHADSPNLGLNLALGFLIGIGSSTFFILLRSSLSE